MKWYAYLGIITILAGLITWAYNEVYDAGATSEKLICTTEKKDQADKYILELDKVRKSESEAVEKANIVAREHYATMISEVEKNAKLRKKLSNKPAIEECVKNDAGVSIAYLSAESISVLDDCRQATSLPEAANQFGFVTKNKVTATDLAEYTCKAISEYNRCAIEVNSAIEEQRINHAESNSAR